MLPMAGVVAGCCAFACIYRAVWSLLANLKLRVKNVRYYPYIVRAINLQRP